MSDDSTKEIIPGSWRRIIRDEIWENESPKINACWTTVGELQKLERELAEVTKQRDELADALNQLMDVVATTDAAYDDRWATEIEINDAWHAGNKALKTLKGGDK